MLRSFLAHRHCIAGILLLSFILAGCRINKYVPDHEYLLSKVTIDLDQNVIDKTELRTYQKQKPNTRIFGFWRFHLGLYNLSSKNKTNDWLKKIGEPPVVYDPSLKLKTTEEFRHYLQNKGYFNATIKDSTVLKPNGRAEVYYFIRPNEPYLIQSFQREIRDDSIRLFLDNPDKLSLIKPNSAFDSDVLGEESLRLLKKLQNAGFYTTTKNILYYQADSTRKNHGVDLKLIIEKETCVDSLHLSGKRNHEKYVFRNFYYLNEKEVKNSLLIESEDLEPIKSDTLKIGSHYFVYKGKKRLRPDLLMNANHLADRYYYSSEMVDRTYNEYFSTRLFKLINIRFVETGKRDPSGNPMLDCFIQLTPSLTQSYSASVEGTNSLGNVGVAGNLGYQHKNLFRGGEIFDLQFVAGTQKQSAGSADTASVFNSSETGVDARLTVPKFIAPFFRTNFFRYSTPQTFFNLSYNYQKTPDYTRTIARSAFGYQWKSSDYATHRVNLLDLNLVKMFALDSSFLSSIENLYIKSSYVDHSISSFNYSYTYSTQTKLKSDYLVLKTNIETAGNLLYATGQLFSRPKHISEDGKLNQYHFLNTPFTQYIKFDFEYRMGWMLGKHNGFAIRTYGGAAFAYGNSDQIPFERKFFSGGTNGIRAWPIRTLGPGSFRANPTEFPNQSGDIKLEANAEYRFRLLGPMEGAMFMDVGNIWSVKDNRPGTEFTAGSFIKELAVCSGIGLRYDFTYVILRLDLGIKLHDPALSEGKRWISPGDYLQKGNQNLVFAIGYPF